eukprot:scaffold61542_cov63-Phaeocystis_antarctica.AAC.8
MARAHIPMIFALAPADFLPHALGGTASSVSAPRRRTHTLQPAASGCQQKTRCTRLPCSCLPRCRFFPCASPSCSTCRPTHHPAPRRNRPGWLLPPPSSCCCGCRCGRATY